jgi:hypothetical protein
MCITQFHAQRERQNTFDGHALDLGRGELGEVVVEDRRRVEPIRVSFGRPSRPPRALHLSQTNTYMFTEREREREIEEIEKIGGRECIVRQTSDKSSGAATNLIGRGLRAPLHLELVDAGLLVVRFLPK